MLWGLQELDTKAAASEEVAVNCKKSLRFINLTVSNVWTKHKPG